MHGLERRKLSPRMPSTKTTSKTGVIDSNASCFIKDGRKISVGDCALFKPAKDSPPFIGIIRCWTFERESNIKLLVNWLYRPAEVKLVKGVALEAAPNEVFYSFHSDEIPSASFLHPCKVAFLPKGVELPSGISSFVCRRVYDITNKCLWWLTDQDHIHDRNEVDQLLHKTHIEMQASVEQRQGPRHSPDSLQNSRANLSFHGKGKKRERGDQSCHAIKREQSSKFDDGDSGHLKSESMLNMEIAKFSEKGGLVNFEDVARLVRLMQPEKSEKKIDLTARCMLAGVISATDKFDCLNQFVELGGLLVLNEWLQEVHKGKIGDLGNLKNSYPVDDFLLVLLRALDKLPVNLNALQMCNIGKSVNHLRSHKNSEIQKKARTLVDTWKKRVEDEMLNDEGRSQQDSSHGGSRNPNGSDAVVRSPIRLHSTLKSMSVKHWPGDSNSKSSTLHPGGARSTLSPTSTTDNCKDGQSLTNTDGRSSEPQIVAKEEKSSSTSQSHTNNQCSSDQPKNMVPCGKEDNRRSTSGSRSLNKIEGTTKHRKSANGPSSGVHRETRLSKCISMAKTSAVDKVYHSAVDESIQESNNHKLIVKIPNGGQGSAESVVDDFLQDSSCRNSRASSPAISEKFDQSDPFVRGNNHDYHQVQEVDGSLTSVQKNISESKRSHNVLKIACSPSRNQIKSRKTHDSSLRSTNDLVECFPKLSEAVSMPAGDDGDVNLLASVVTKEISKPGSVSPSVSPHTSFKMAENSIIDLVVDQKQMNGDDVIQQLQSTKVANTDNHITVAFVPKGKEEISKLYGAQSDNREQSEDGCLKNNGTLIESFETSSTPGSVTTIERGLSDHGAETIKAELKSKEESQNELPVGSEKAGASLESQDKIKAASSNDELEKKDQTYAEVCPPNDDDNDEKMNVNKVPQSDVALEQSTLVRLQYDSMNTSDNSVMASIGASHHLTAKLSIEVKSEKTDAVAVYDSTSEVAKRILDKEICPSASERQVESEDCCADVDQNQSCENQNLENEESGTSVLRASCDVLLKEELHSTVEGSKSTAVEEVIKRKSGPPTENSVVSTASRGSNVDSKLGFDLNEGFNVDEGKNDEPVNFATGIISPLQIPVSSASCGLPALVTVAAAAKGSFVPPDDLMWNKREFGWRGSAATSAFRPAEPRKAAEVPLDPRKSLSDAPAVNPARFPLDIDLNVADESSGQEFVVRNSTACELMTTASLYTSGGLDLDLNKIDEAPEMAFVGRHMASNIKRVEVSTQHVNPSISNDGAVSGKLDFDLNDGPATEDMHVEHILSSQHNRGHVPVQLPLGPRFNSSGTGNCFSWYPPGTNYSSVTPSALPDREAFTIHGIGGGPQCVMGGPMPALSFNPESYRGSALSSSPGLPFHSSPFQYPVLPYGTSFPLPAPALVGGSSGYMDPVASSRISAIPSQLVGNAASVSFQYPYAYVASRSIPDVGSNGVIESGRNRGKQGLDLNSGPGVLDVEGRDVSLPTVSRQVSTISSQSLADVQARMHSMVGGHLKRKEPEGGWNIDKLNFKQSSWR